jgi:hypothetical protein
MSLSGSQALEVNKKYVNIIILIYAPQLTVFFFFVTASAHGTLNCITIDSVKIV